MTDVLADPDVLLTTEDGDDADPVVQLQILRMGVDGLNALFKPTAGMRDVDAHAARAGSAVFDGLDPALVPETRPYFAAKAQLAAYDRATAEKRHQLTADIPRLKSLVSSEAEDLDTPDLCGRIASANALAGNACRELETLDEGRRVLLEIVDRHRSPAAYALLRVAMLRVQRLTAEASADHDAALARLAQAAGPAVVAALKTGKVLTALRRTDVGAVARNFVNSSL